MKLTPNSIKTISKAINKLEDLIYYFQIVLVSSSVRILDSVIFWSNFWRKWLKVTIPSACILEFAVAATFHAPYIIPRKQKFLGRSSYKTVQSGIIHARHTLKSKKNFPAFISEQPLSTFYVRNSFVKRKQ